MSIKLTMTYNGRSVSLQPVLPPLDAVVPPGPLEALPPPPLDDEALPAAPLPGLLPGSSNDHVVALVQVPATAANNDFAAESEEAPPPGHCEEVPHAKKKRRLLKVKESTVLCARRYSKNCGSAINAAKSMKDIDGLFLFSGVGVKS